MRGRFVMMLVCGLFAAWGHAAEPVDPSLLLWLPFDEGRGTFAIDRSDNLLEADLSQLRWATGTFGTAVHFGGTNAFAELPPVPGLNGATQFTLSVWATWEDPAPRRYPNLLTSHNWSPGGMMLFVSDTACSFRLGRPCARAGSAGPQWTETGVPLLNQLPQRTWTHLCVTFALPNLVTYVNGKQVGRTTWSYPVEAQALRLGGWLGAVSHHGLLDDLRIYGRTFSGEEVAALASPKDRASAAYVLVDEAASAEPPEARFRTRYAELAIDAAGQAVSLRNRASGRELLARPAPLVRARLADGRSLTARRVAAQGNRLTFSFPRGQGDAVLEVDARRDFLTFTVCALTLSNAVALTFCELPTAPATYHGGMANMLSDDIDAVCLRGYELPVETKIRATHFRSPRPRSTDSPAGAPDSPPVLKTRCRRCCARWRSMRAYRSRAAAALGRWRRSRRAALISSPISRMPRLTTGSRSRGAAVSRRSTCTAGGRRSAIMRCAPTITARSA